MRTAILLLTALLPCMAQSTDFAEGKRLFSNRCAGCHGLYGEGGRGAALNSGTFRRGGSDVELFRTIRNGVPNTEMPGTNMPDAEITYLVNYVKSLSQTPAVAAAGDVSAGQAVYASSGCSACHSIEGSGGDLGPDLSRVGLRPAAFLRDSIVEPDREVNFNYLTANATTAAGEKVRGIFLNEDDYSIQIRDSKGNPRSFLKRDLRAFAHEKGSLMPAFTTLSETDLTNLVAYLSSLRTKPAP